MASGRQLGPPFSYVVPNSETKNSGAIRRTYRMDLPPALGIFGCRTSYEAFRTWHVLLLLIIYVTARCLGASGSMLVLHFGVVSQAGGSWRVRLVRA